MSLYDISPTVSTALAVWPGDTPPSREVLLEMRQGDNLTLSTLHGTVHLGAHADAPSHYGRDAESIETRSVERYLGRCRVLHVPAPRGSRVAESRRLAVNAGPLTPSGGRSAVVETRHAVPAAGLVRVLLHAAPLLIHHRERGL